MSYMRTPHYVYDSEEGCRLECQVTIGHDHMDAIALMRVANIWADTDDPGRFARAFEIVKANEGNANAIDLLDDAGLDASGAWRRKMAIGYPQVPATGDTA